MSFLFRFHDLIGGIHVPIDDGVDKLNRKYTLVVFLFLALPIFTRQYIGDPIECFTPTYFTDAQARFVNSYCWTASTYYLVSEVEAGAEEGGADQAPAREPPDPRVQPEELDYAGFETPPAGGAERLRRVHVSYYQWAPLILLVQGCCFHLPFVLWGACAHSAGVKLRRLLKRASDIASLPPGCQQREALLSEFVDQFHTLVAGSAGCCTDPACGLPLACRCVGGPTRYLCLLYLLVKSMYVLNVGLQFLLLTAFLGRGFLRHGLELARRIMADGDWWNSPRFPLQTLCQVRAALQGGLRTYLCRCVLPINVFNEKIFSVVWFYLALLLPLNLASLLLWLWRCFRCNRFAFVRLCLWRTRMVSLGELSRVSRKIAVNYLGWDGVFVLRLIENNHGSAMATIILGRMYDFYANQMKAQDDGSDVELGPMPPSVAAQQQAAMHPCHPGACHGAPPPCAHQFGTGRPGGYWGR